MKVRIRKIGNSKGIIFPKEVLDKCNFKDDVEISISADNKLIVEPLVSKRAIWERDFEKAKKDGKLDSVDLDTPTKFDEEEWEW